MMKGKVAFCSKRIPGIITHDEKQPVKYEDGTEDTAYVGINLLTGEPWSSRNPVIIGSFSELKSGYLSEFGVDFFEEWLDYEQNGQQREE